jgi:hypothetical protein
MRNRLSITVRELALFVVIVALASVWWRDHLRIKSELLQTRAERVEQKEKTDELRNEYYSMIESQHFTLEEDEAFRKAVVLMRYPDAIARKDGTWDHHTGFHNAWQIHSVAGTEGRVIGDMGLQESEAWRYASDAVLKEMRDDSLPRTREKP